MLNGPGAVSYTHLSWFEEHGLDLATEKTETVLLTRGRIPTVIAVQVGAETMKAVKYLGVRLSSAGLWPM